MDYNPKTDTFRKHQEKYVRRSDYNPIPNLFVDKIKIVILIKILEIQSLYKSVIRIIILIPKYYLNNKAYIDFDCVALYRLCGTVPTMWHYKLFCGTITDKYRNILLSILPIQSLFPPHIFLFFDRY